MPKKTETPTPVRDTRQKRQVLDDFLSEYVDWPCPLTEKMVNATRFELMVAAAWAKAMVGDAKYFTQLFDRILGKEPVHVRHSGPAGEPIKMYKGVSPDAWDNDIIPEETIVETVEPTNPIKPIGPDNPMRTVRRAGGNGKAELDADGKRYVKSGRLKSGRAMRPGQTRK